MRKANRALTLIEVLAVVTVVVVLIAMLLPALGGSHRSSGPSCRFNVSQIGRGFIMYVSDNNGQFPIQTSVTNGGTMEFTARNQTFPHYQKLAGYGLGPSTFICPDDKKRHMAENFPHLTDSNLSYFLNADVFTNNASIMTGDRHLKANGKPVGHGMFKAETNMDLSWTAEMHRGIGVLGFADGHAEISRATNLNTFFQNQGMAAVRLSVP